MPFIANVSGCDAIIDAAKVQMRNAATGDEADAIFKQMIKDCISTSIVATTATGTASSVTPGGGTAPVTI